MESLLGHRHGPRPSAFMIKEPPGGDHERARHYLWKNLAPRTHSASTRVFLESVNCECRVFWNCSSQKTIACVAISFEVCNCKVQVSGQKVLVRRGLYMRQDLRGRWPKTVRRRSHVMIVDIFVVTSLRTHQGNIWKFWKL